MCQPRRTKLNLPTSYRGHVKKVINGYLDATTGVRVWDCAKSPGKRNGRRQNTHPSRAAAFYAQMSKSQSAWKSPPCPWRAREQRTASTNSTSFSAPVFYAASLLATWETCFDREPCMLPVLFSAGQDCASLQDPWASLCRGFKWAKGRLGASYGRT